MQREQRAHVHMGHHRRIISMRRDALVEAIKKY